MTRATGSCRQHIIKLLKEKPHTVKELCKILGRDNSTVSEVLRNLHGRAYISSWNGNQPTWTWGNEAHVPKPVAVKVPQPSRVRHTDAYILKRQFVTTERIWGI